VSWKKVPLSSLVELITKGTTPTSVGYDFTDSGINFVKIESINLNGNFIKNKFAKIDNECNEALKRSQLKEGDILFSIAGALGRTAIVTGEILPANTNQALAIIRLKDNNLISKEFLIKVLTSESILNQVSLMKGGVAQQNLSLAQLKDFLIPLPSLKIQKKIVIKLDAIFAQIDTAKAAAEANASNAEALFQSFLKEIFNNSKKQSIKIKLENIANITSSKRIMKHEYVDEGVPFYRTKEVKELANKRVITTELFISKENYNEIKSKFGAPKKGEILITAIGTIGEIYVIDTDDEFYFKDGNVLWAKDLKEIEPEFLKYVLISFVNELNDLSLGAAYSALPIHKLKNYEILIPNLEHQRILILAIQKMESYSKKLSAEYIKKISLYSSLKQSILQQAFSGELVKD
jgi:type I restriction enzyme S subunit